MQKVQTVAILGAGAMGAYFAAQFYQAPGFSTMFLASGKRLEKLNRHGLVVNGVTYRIPAIDPAQADAPADLIIVALKHQHLKDAVHNLGKLVADTTTFLSVMNGLESEETIGAIYGIEKMLYAISLRIDAVRQGNQVTYTTPGIHYFGEAQNDIITPKVRRVQVAFDQAGIHYQTPPDMIRMLWWKFMFNVGINQASAVMRATYGVFQSKPQAQALMEALMREVLSLAQAAGVNLTEQDLLDWYPVLNRLSPNGKTSMLQDIEANRITEVEVFAGKVISLGKAFGIATPVNQTIYQIIQVLEQNVESSSNRPSISPKY